MGGNPPGWAEKRKRVEEIETKNINNSFKSFAVKGSREMGLSLERSARSGENLSI